MSDAHPPTVLIVEDEPDVAETYARWLPDYDVKRVETGEAALDTVNDNVDVVLLDRMLPDISGTDILETIRDRGIDCRVALVTAVDPGMDILDLGFDEYVRKPSSRDELRDVVELLLERASLDDALQEYYSLVARRTALESEYERDELTSNPEYQQLLNRIETHRDALDHLTGDLSSKTDFVGAVREITRSQSERNKGDVDE